MGQIPRRVGLPRRGALEGKCLWTMLQRINLGTSDKHTAHRIASRLNILPADGRDH